MKCQKTIVVLVFISIVSLTAVYLSQPSLWFNKKNAKTNSDCVTAQTEKTVRGSSMEPLIKAGQTLILLENYYQCHPVQRGDIVAYNYAGNDVPIIKIVKAIPGDSWRIKKEYQQNSYQIIVNDKPLKNSEGKYYQIPESNIKMLKLYAKSYPLLPDNTYLILGNNISGSLDATRFGLVSKSDILGKVEVCR